MILLPAIDEMLHCFGNILDIILNFELNIPVNNGFI